MEQPVEKKQQPREDNAKETTGSVGESGGNVKLTNLGISSSSEITPNTNGKVKRREVLPDGTVITSY